MKLTALRAAAGDPRALAGLLWKPVLGLALVAALYLWAHHAGAVSQAREDATEIGTLKGKLIAAGIRTDLAVQANATQAATIATLKAENARWASEADRLADEGLAAVQAEERRAAKAEAEAKRWADRYTRETGKPKCAAALAALPLACPNLKDY